MVRRLFGVALGLSLVVALTLATQAQGQGAKDAKDSGVGQGKMQHGKLVKIDPDTGVVVIQTEGNKELRFKTIKTTKYYGEDDKELKEGIKATGFRPGAEIRFLPGTDNQELQSLWIGRGTPAKDGKQER